MQNTARQSYSGHTADCQPAALAIQLRHVARLNAHYTCGCVTVQDGASSARCTSQPNKDGLQRQAAADRISSVGLH